MYLLHALSGQTLCWSAEAEREVLETGFITASRSFYYSGEGRLRPKSEPLNVVVHMGTPCQFPRLGISRNAS